MGDVHHMGTGHPPLCCLSWSQTEGGNLLWSVKIMQDVQRSRRQENADRVAQQIGAGGYAHHLAPLKHLDKQDHHDDVPNFSLQLIEWADFHPLGPLLHNPIRKEHHRSSWLRETKPFPFLFWVFWMSFTFKANIPNREEPLRARSMAGGRSGGTLLMNSPYKPIPNISITVPAK